MGRFSRELFGDREQRQQARAERLAARARGSDEYRQRTAEIREREIHRGEARAEERLERAAARPVPTMEDRMFERAYQLSTLALWLYALSVLVPVVVIVALVVWVLH